MAFNFKKEEDVKEYLENLNTEYKFGCYSEKNPESCHLLGDYMEAIKKDFVKAAKLYKTTCDEYNYPRSCHSYASHALLGRGLPKADLPEALQYFEKGCEQNYGDSCSSAGIMNASNEPSMKPFKNYSKAVAYMEKGCALGSALSCYYLCGLYISGSTDKTSVPKDMKKASKFATMGCDLKDIPSCTNLSIMYRRGDGVEKNEEKAEEYKKKTLELQKELDDTLLLNFQRGPET